jgi:hypothetical protein
MFCIPANLSLFDDNHRFLGQLGHSRESRRTGKFPFKILIFFMQFCCLSSILPMIPLPLHRHLFYSEVFAGLIYTQAIAVF